MKYTKLTEYNKSPRSDRIDISIIKSRLDKAVGPIGLVGVDKAFYIFYFAEDGQCFYILSDRNREDVYGYVILNHISDDIWQVKDAIVFDTNKGIGTTLYHFIVRKGNNLQNVQTKRLIHDTQLSPQAERLWKDKLVSTGLIRKIYDKKLNKMYDETMIGKPAADGIGIKNPEDDIVDTFLDYDHSGMRFFWLVESQHKQPSISELRNQFLLEGRTSDVDERVLSGIKDNDKTVDSWIWCGDNINMPGRF